MQKQSAFRISYNGVSLSVIADNIRQVAISFENDSLSLDTINTCFPHSSIQTDSNVCVQNDFSTSQPSLESVSTETQPTQITTQTTTQDHTRISTNRVLENARKTLWAKIDVIDARQILKFCRQSKSRKEITDSLGIVVDATQYDTTAQYHQDLAQVRQVLIWELFRAGYLKMTNTNFPTELIAKRHPFQKFKSTQDGLDLLRKLNDLKRQGNLNNNPSSTESLIIPV